MAIAAGLMKIGRLDFTPRIEVSTDAVVISRSLLDQFCTRMRRENIHSWTEPVAFESLLVLIRS